jgi:hypothetical protein
LHTCADKSGHFRFTRSVHIHKIVSLRCRNYTSVFSSKHTLLALITSMGPCSELHYPIDLVRELVSHGLVSHHITFLRVVLVLQSSTFTFIARSCIATSVATLCKLAAAAHRTLTAGSISNKNHTHTWSKLAASQFSCGLTSDHTSTGKRITSLTIALIHSALTHATLASSITSQDRNQQITCLDGITHYSVTFVHSCSQHLNLKSSCLNRYYHMYLAACSCLPDLRVSQRLRQSCRK